MKILATIFSLPRQIFNIVEFKSCILTRNYVVLHVSLKIHTLTDELEFPKKQSELDLNLKNSTLLTFEVSWHLVCPLFRHYEDES